jgi:hypothetical protein
VLLRVRALRSSDSHATVPIVELSLDGASAAAAADAVVRERLETVSPGSGRRSGLDDGHVAGTEKGRATSGTARLAASLCENAPFQRP